MDKLSRRIERIEKRLEPDGKGRRHPDIDIWDESFAPNLPELAEWALGHTDERPDFWPSEEQAAELRRQGYVVETREELRETFEMMVYLNQRAKEAETRMVGYGVTQCCTD